MKAIKSEHLIYFDVDDTLILWTDKFDVVFECPHTKNMLQAQRHAGHIRLLKEKKIRGWTIVVWSQGGWEYAKAVVQALHLESFVDYVQTKPQALVDDLNPGIWLPTPLYLDPKKKYKNAS